MLNKQKQAIELMREKKYEEAAKLFIEIIDENPEDPIGYINFGNVLELMHQHDKAERFYLKAIELDEKSATAFVGLGKLYYGQNMLTESEKMFQHSLRLGIEDGEVFYLLGMIHVKRKDLMLAIPFLQRADELSEDAEIKFQYGLVLAQTNYLKEAKIVLEEVIKLKNTHADALYNLGIIAVQENDNEVALSYINRALDSEPNHLLAIKAKRNLLEKTDR